MSRKTCAVLSFILNLAVLVLVIYSVAKFFFASGDGNMEETGAVCFRYFTIDSNILAAIASALLLPYEFKRAVGNSEKIPTALSILKLAGTVAVTITFVVVMVFLGPTIGYGKMFEGANIFLHALCPIFAIVSFIFFDGGNEISRKQGLPALLPVVIYGLLYFVMVIIITESNGGWKDFYGFNMGGFWPVSIAAMFLVNVLFVMLLRKLRNKFIRRA